ncbi:hypothetical protein LPJ59_003252 [Coemansia sp. RSA 2399]|nr:hypothetical protein LPJ59_003252 [Coemansia sp. RSA 2399]KAJ1903726.1 hypothetical protein LPJ81_002907 [Coemansia sp. IMI 209127]
MGMRDYRLYGAKDSINRLAREEEIKRVLSEKSTNPETIVDKPKQLKKVSKLTPDFSQQLVPLDLHLQPASATSTGGGGGGGGVDPSSKGSGTPGAPDTSTEAVTKHSDAPANQPVDQKHQPQDILDKAFSQAIRDDLFNMLTVGLVRHSHTLLYSEDPWSEGYSIPLLADMASKLGSRVHALDIPDLAVLTSRIDPVFEDLTIVSHPYSPPPDLDPGNRNSSNGSRMSFFAGIDRKRCNDEGDTMSEQVDSRSDGSALGRDEDAAFPDDEGDRKSERAAAFARGGIGIGRGGGNGSDGFVGHEAESGDPVLSREMMTNPLSQEATKRLDDMLDRFVSSMSPESGDAKPCILAIKNLGDLLNTRIGYTLFTRLVTAVTKHNTSWHCPVVVVGLMHPSIFHQDTPPPGIPPFDVNPATPNALIPIDSRPRSSRRGIEDIFESLIGGGNRGAKGINANLGARFVQMEGEAQPAGILPRRSPISIFPTDVECSDANTLLPLFSRVGIPPPNQSVFAKPYDMSPPGFVQQEPGSGDAAMVGSLRQLLNAEQCLERNARSVRNICLLYKVPGLELSNEELAFLKAHPQNAEPNPKASIGIPNKAKKRSRNSENVYTRGSLYELDEDEAVVVTLLRKDLWGLDHRPLVTMLRSLPDDVARRFFIGETFLHRWISLAQALAIRESVDFGKDSKSFLTSQRIAENAFIGSRHLIKAWVQLLESSVALRQGYAAASVGEDEEMPTEAKIPSGILALHGQVDFADIGVGRRAEDDMELYPDMSNLQNKTPVNEGSDSAEKNVSEPNDAAQGPQQSKESAFKQWASVTEELDAEADDVDMGGSDYGGSGKGKHAGTTVSPQKRIQLAKKSLTDYEERLVGSIIDPLSIPTGFSQVCVKQETVTTLQEIITLPMLRPEYFSKGVLRRYGVSGILLFGPPGTGKTMLAKAVAKESGSVVLNIRASDIYDKYVGEGEKLAEAVFTLARKVAPCVIFIDEVDALFSARSSGEQNKFRRDIMNQIMSEWDGINTSRKRGASADSAGGSPSQPPPQVTVMAATNRPFDLDDAILRRLPRRILIDLPNADERARILAIHLQGEDLEQDVDLKALARRSDSFSGSDLKNLCVAAALAALRERVREEVAGTIGAVDSEDQPKPVEKEDKAKDEGDQLSLSLIEQLKTARHSRPGTGADGRKMPPIRLGGRHFDAALKKVAPSSSDRMESLVELRKWDKLYGDGAQERNRKPSSIGFAGVEAAPEAAAAAKAAEQQGSNGSNK